MKYIFTLLIICAVFASRAQIKINGVVQIQSSEFEPATHARITNLNNNKIAYTDDAGYYTIDAQRGDSLEVSSLGFYTFGYKVPYSIGNLLKNFLLVKKIKEMKGAFIISKSKYQLDSIARAENNSKILNYTPVSTIQSPISSLASLWSKSARDKKNLKKQVLNDEKLKYIDTKYNVKIVNELTKLEGDTAAMFINAYPMEYEYARSASDLEIKMWIKSNYRESLKQTQISTLKE